MTNIFFGFWRKAGFAMALATILFCYSALPDNIAISHAETGEPTGYISKQAFFYWSAGLLLAFNLLLLAFRDQLLKLNFQKINPVSEWARHPKQLTTLLKGWFEGFLAFINSYLVFVLLGLYNVNSNRGQRLDMNYNWFMILGVAVLIFILFFLPLKLLYTSPPPEND